MMKSKVSVVICDSYDKEKVYNAVKKSIESIGGIGEFVKPDERILVKPNFLSPSESEKAITTHPSVISAVLKILHETQYNKVKVGDSPANGNCRAALGKLALTDEELFGATVADMDKEVLVKFPEGKIANEFYYCREVTEADAVIGLCKMKTHALERITGAVKNMYGLICGKRKAAGHVKYPTAVNFAKMLCDIHKSTPQRLHIMDAVVAMEGNGPSSGSPINMNMIIASPDPVALDTVFCRLVHLNPSLVPTNVQASLVRLGTMDEKEIEIILTDGESTTVCDISELVRKYGNPDFDVVRDKDKVKTALSIISKVTGGNRKPVIDKSKCVKCGICVDHCPVEGKAVDFVNGKTKPPVYNYKKCIRCYCCQELCPQKAISVKGIF